VLIRAYLLSALQYISKAVLLVDQTTLSSPYMYYVINACVNSVWQRGLSLNRTKGSHFCLVVKIDYTRLSRLVMGSNSRLTKMKLWITGSYRLLFTTNQLLWLCQCHQHCMCSFYMRVDPKSAKMTVKSSAILHFRDLQA